MKELAGIGPVSELGIGTGRIALPLASQGIEVHGIDSSIKYQYLRNEGVVRENPVGTKLVLLASSKSTIFNGPEIAEAIASKALANAH